MSTKMQNIALSMLIAGTSLMANSDNMAESLMKLRAEVEQLDSSIADEKDAFKGSMKSLRMQKNDLEALIAREDLRIKQLNAEMSKVKKEVKEAGKNSVGLKPLVLDALAMLEKEIQAQIPFKTVDRVADIQRIQTQLENDEVTAQKALALAWNTYGDAIRMSKENGIFKQTITLNGQDRLAEVARVGTMMMYFKTPNDEMGYVVKEQAGWTYKQVLDKTQKDQIASLFDAFKKQIRTGYFTLPNALATTEVK
ncbi:MAG: DUF3450 family protein [Helicobacteraceae bacterium]|jgi:hypothetical protein|nr:DUF3450 family protein [Helicobacteraceae bacterium]